MGVLLATQVACGAIPASSVDNICVGKSRLTKNIEKDYPVCLINGAALSLDFMQTPEKNKWSQAVEAFIFRKKGEARSGGICGTFAAVLVETKDPHNEGYNLCRFSDGSYIDETTLWLGPGHNEELDSELRSIGISNSL